MILKIGGENMGWVVDGGKTSLFYIKHYIDM